jgi:hypothetical protein
MSLSCRLRRLEQTADTTPCTGATAATLRSEWCSTTKRYVTLVDGPVDRAAWLADAPLRRVQQGSSNSKPKASPSDARPANGQSSGEKTSAAVLACGPGFVSTTLGLENRVRDRSMVEEHLVLPEDGACWDAGINNDGLHRLKLVDLHGRLLATEYSRVVYGDHG